MVKRNKRDLIIGCGEVGSTLLSVLSQEYNVDSIDKDPKRSSVLFPNLPVEFMHICMPYFDGFEEAVYHYVNTFFPYCVVIHSTVPPKTGMRIQDRLFIPVISSPVRGVHKNFKNDILYFTKYFGFNISDHGYRLPVTSEYFKRYFSKVGITCEELSDGKTCELGKILCDTTYYGWKIVYRFLTEWVAKDFDVDPKEIWALNDESKQPITYADPKGIGGHCVLPNLELLNNPLFEEFISNKIKGLNEIQIKRNSK